MATRVAGTRFTEGWLADLAHHGDRPADAVIGALADVAAVTAANRRAAFPEVAREIWRDIDDPDINDSVKNFLMDGAQLDKHIDTKKVRDAQAFFEEHGVAIITALFHAALPEAYLGRRGVQVLDMTGELVSNWARRIQETGQFLVSVLTPTPDTESEGKTSLSAGEQGARAARRVRLTHAAIRWLLDGTDLPMFDRLMLRGLDKHTLWTHRMVEIGEEEEAGDKFVVRSHPLNQEDLLATLGTFTTVTFDALSKFAVTFDDDDRDAYHHLWNVVGWHLGIGDAASVPQPDEPAPNQWPDNNILPLGVDEMDRLYRWLGGRLQHGTSQGCRLAKTLVQELALPLPRPFERMPAVVMRYLIGDDKADELEIERGGYTELLTVRTGMLERVARRSARLPVGPKMMSLAGQALTRYALREFVARSRGSDRGLQIDPAIAARWGVQIGPEVRPVRRA
jgi:ER-bound oxygenase mpaB/B'/Rubber oxygenase, catalytic domain